MHMFKSSLEAQAYEQQVRQAADSLLQAFKGGEYKTAIAVLDWLKDAVAANACVIGPDEGALPSCCSPSFPIQYLNVRDDHTEQC